MIACEQALREKKWKRKHFPRRTCSQAKQMIAKGSMVGRWMEWGYLWAWRYIWSVWTQWLFWEHFFNGPLINNRATQKENFWGGPSEGDGLSVSRLSQGGKDAPYPHPNLSVDMIIVYTLMWLKRLQWIKNLFHSFCFSIVKAGLIDWNLEAHI